ncbi:hypothetical protein V1515DRAFT_578243 [Lipomyces mesembrius]
MPPDGPEHWADCYFEENRLGHRTSNVAESLNSWILEARSLPVQAMMDNIRIKMMMLRAERLKDIDKLRKDGKRITGDRRQST